MCQECWVVCILWNTWNRELEVLNICLSGDGMELLFSSILTGWSNPDRYSSLVSLGLEIAAISYSDVADMFPPAVHRPGRKDLYKNGVSSVTLTLLDLGKVVSTLELQQEKARRVTVWIFPYSIPFHSLVCVEGCFFMSEWRDTSTRFVERQFLLEGW